MNNGNFQYYNSSAVFHGGLEGVMGTRFDVVVVGISEPEAVLLWNKATAELRRLDSLFNRFQADSEISFVNANASFHPIEVSPELFQVLDDCRIYHAKTEGIFDITLHDFSQVKLDKSQSTVAFLMADISLDLGGYAKGYALTKIRELFSEAGVTQALVNFGNSSILGIGTHPYGDSWRVSVENPYQKDTILGEFALKDSSLSTSGNTPSYSEHIVHPRLGKRAGGRKVACVVMKNPEEAEVLSTTLMLADNAERERIIKRFEVEYWRIFDAG